MGSLWPNFAQVFLVRHVQLMRARLQVAYLYLVPRYLLAARTTLLPPPPLAVTDRSSVSEALGGVSATSEGSFGPAVPSVNEPCEGELSADVTSGGGVVLPCGSGSSVAC